MVFNAKYAEYVDIAATEFTRVLWGDYSRLLSTGIDNQVVSLSIDWHTSATFDDVLAIQVSVEHIGKTSYTLNMHISSYHSSEEKSALIAQANITYVVVDAQQYQKMTIPDRMRQKLQEGATGVIVNHSGHVF